MRSFLLALCLVATPPAAAAPLHDAVAEGNLAEAEALLKAGADVNAETYNQFTALHLVKTPDMAELLLRYHPLLNETSISGRPLQNAAENWSRHGDDENEWETIVDLLRKAGADYDIISAIYLHDVDRVKAIIDVNPEIALSDFDSTTPLRIAAREGHADICALLLKAGANPNSVQAGYSILRDAVKHPEVVRLLLAAGADIHFRNTWIGGRSGVWLIGNDASALHFAAGEGPPGSIAVLLDSGADPFARTDSSFMDLTDQTPLEIAAAYGRSENLEAILSHSKFTLGSQKERQNSLDSSLLAVAPNGESCSRSIARLLKEGASSQATKDGESAIQRIALNLWLPETSQDDTAHNTDLRKAIAMLAEQGASVDVCSAVAIGDEKRLAELLKLNRASSNDRNLDGVPALQIAVRTGDEELMRLLIEAGCDVNIHSDDDFNWTPLHEAASSGQIEVASLLIKSEADLNAVSDGRTPIDVAGTAEIAMLLFRAGGRPSGADKNITESEGLSKFDVNP